MNEWINIFVFNLLQSENELNCLKNVHIFFLASDTFALFALHSLSRWYMRPYRQAVIRPAVMFECLKLTLPSAATSTHWGCSRTIPLDRTEGYTCLVANLPSNRKSILDSASSTSCPQEEKSDPAQRTRAHTCNRDKGDVTVNQFKGPEAKFTL